MPREIKHSIKGDIKDFFLILNCSYLTITSILSLLGENKAVVLAAFFFCFINSFVSFVFFQFRLKRYQRPENIEDAEEKL